ncbi:MAG: transglycosylase SLT domain-containing protein [Gemmatimonadota bacterium]
MRYLIACAFLGIALLTASLLRPDSAQPRADYTTFLHSQRDTGNRAEAIALVRQAIEHHSNKQYAEAIATYDRAASKLPQIADWLAVFAGSSASFTGDTVDVTRRLASVDQRLAEFAWRSRVRAFTEAGAKNQALELARTLTTSPSAGTRAAAWWHVIELQPRLSARDRAAAGRAFLRNGETSAGLRELEAAVTAGELPLSERAEIRFELGRAFFDSGKYKEAITNLERVPRSHARAADARFLLARAQYRSGRSDDGLRTFRQTAAEYPKSSAATRALFFIADLAHDDGAPERAAQFFAKAATAPARTNESSLARMRMGGIAFVQQDFAKAARIFEQYRRDYPQGEYHNQATYWAAQSALRTGDTTRANELLAALRAKSPVSYYGMLARDHAGEPALPKDIPAGPRTDSVVARNVAKGIDRWHLLREIGWNDAANVEIGRVKDHFKGNASALYQIAETLNEHGAPHLAIATGRELLAAGGMWNLRLFRIMYPLPYMAVIVSESRARGLDPFFVAALIRQESRFNANARSGAGAIGLMQVLPSTGSRIQAQAGVGPVTPQTLTDPSTNIKLGTQFLADVLNSYNQRVDVALVAYNAGPSRASRWRSFPEFGAEDLFIERIPFDETRNYVKVVKLNASIYRALYSDTRIGD